MDAHLHLLQYVFEGLLGVKLPSIMHYFVFFLLSTQKAHMTFPPKILGAITAGVFLAVYPESTLGTGE